MIQPNGNVFQTKVSLFDTNVSSTQSDVLVAFRETDFPLLAGILFGGAKSDGGDIRAFTDEAGTNELSMHIENFDTVNRELVIWVKIDSISSTSTTVIWFTFGNLSLTLPASDSTYGSESASSFYQGRYNMNNSSGNLLDLTSFGRDWTANGTMPNEIAGVFHDAQEFQASNSDFYVSTHRMTPESNGAFTVSFWFRTTQEGNGNSTSDQWWNGSPIIDADESGADDDWGISFQGGAVSVITAGLGDFSATSTTAYGTTQINDGEWHYVTVLFNTTGGTSRILVDDTDSITAVLGTSGERTNTLPTMAKQANFSNFSDIDLDEVRFRDGGGFAPTRHLIEYHFGAEPENNMEVGPAVWVGEKDYKDSILKTEGPLNGFTGEITYTDPNNSDNRVPTAIIVYGNSTGNYTDTNNTSLRQSFGFSDGNSQQLFYSGVQNGQVTSTLGRFTDSSAVYGLTNTTGQGLNNKAHVVEFGQNKVILNWSVTTFNERNITIKFIYGVPATLKTLDPSTSVNGTANNDDLEFKPNLVYAMSLRDGIDGFSTSGDGWSLGFATNYENSIEQGCNTRNAEGNVNPAVIRGVISDSYIVSEIFNDQSDDYDLELTSWDSLGATFTTRNLAPNSTRKVSMLYICMPSNEHARVNFSQVPSGTGNKSFTGLGFEPSAIHRYSGDINGYDTPQSSAASGWQQSMFDVDDEVAFSFRNRNNISPSQTGTRAHTNTIYYRNTLDDVQHEATFVSMDPDGWTEDFQTSTDPTSQVVLALKNGTALGGGQLVNRNPLFGNKLVGGTLVG